MTNNSHVLITAVDSLITCFTALKIKHSGAAQTHRASTNNGVVLNPLEIEKKKFVECAAYILLYMRSLEHTNTVISILTKKGGIRRRFWTIRHITAPRSTESTARTGSSC